MFMMSLQEPEFTAYIKDKNNSVPWFQLAGGTRRLTKEVPQKVDHFVCCTGRCLHCRCMYCRR